MNSLDINAETEALRRKSPFVSRVVLIAEILGSVVVCLLLFAAFFAEDTPSASRGAIVAMCLGGITITVAFMLAFYFRAKILIDRGLIVQATLEDSKQVRQNVRLRLSAKHNGEIVQFPIYVPSGLAREVQNLGYAWLVIDPQSPKRAVPLWEFAGMKNLFAVASGNRGILDPK